MKAPINMFTGEIWTFERKLRWLWVVADKKDVAKEDQKNADIAKFSAIYGGETTYGLIPVLSPAMERHEAIAYIECCEFTDSVKREQIYEGEEITAIYEIK